MNPEDKTGWRTVAMFELLVLVVFVAVWIIREARHGDEISATWTKAADAFEHRPQPESDSE